jgi:hypothetical protein
VELGFEPQKAEFEKKDSKSGYLTSSHGIIFSSGAFRGCEQYEGLSVKSRFDLAIPLHNA